MYESENVGFLYMVNLYFVMSLIIKTSRKGILLSVSLSTLNVMLGTNAFRFEGNSLKASHLSSQNVRISSTYLIHSISSGFIAFIITVSKYSMYRLAKTGLKELSMLHPNFCL